MAEGSIGTEACIARGGIPLEMKKSALSRSKAPAENAYKHTHENLRMKTTDMSEETFWN